MSKVTGKLKLKNREIGKLESQFWFQLQKTKNQELRFWSWFLTSGYNRKTGTEYIYKR